MGDHVEFLSVARGKPLPEVTWFKDDEIFIGDDNCSIKTTEYSDRCEVKSSLSFNKTILEDEHMNYRIEAENSVGKCSTNDFGLIGKQLGCIYILTKLSVMVDLVIQIVFIFDGTLRWYLYCNKIMQLRFR